MVDLAFLLLTFFMLASSFNQPQAMELVMPPRPEPGEETREQAIKESKALTLIPAANDRLFWYRGITDPILQESAFGEDGLHGMLRKSLEATPDLVVLIKPLDEARFANLVEILDDMAITKTPRYALVDAAPMDFALVDAFVSEHPFQISAP